MVEKVLKEIVAAMENHYGKTHWWPGDSPFEIAVGAILTQNTAWTNVEKAIDNLKRAKLLHPRRMLDVSPDRLEDAIRSSGYFRQKAKRLRTFCDFLQSRYRGSMKRMAAAPLEVLRPELLALNGIGPETADDILLYACEKPIFVVDTYTRRILSRHGIVKETAGYHEIQELFHAHLATDVHLFKEFHGLIVYTGKDFCRRIARCEACPLQPMPGKMTRKKKTMNT